MERKRFLLAAGVLLLAVLAAYARSFHGPFVFDDLTSIPENPNIQTLWPLTKAMSPPPELGALGGRPLPALSFAVNYALGGLDVRGYHVANLLLHLASVLLVWRVVARSLQSPALAGRYRRRGHGLRGRAALGRASAAVRGGRLHRPAHRADDGVLLPADAVRVAHRLDVEAAGTPGRAPRSRPAHWGWPARSPWCRRRSWCCCTTSRSAAVPSARCSRSAARSTRASRPPGWSWRRSSRAARRSRGALGGAGKMTSFEYLRLQTRALTHYLRLVVWPHPLRVVYDWTVPGPELVGAAGPRRGRAARGVRLGRARGPTLGRLPGRVVLPDPGAHLERAAAAHRARGRAPDVPPAASPCWRCWWSRRRTLLLRALPDARARLRAGAAVTALVARGVRHAHVPARARLPDRPDRLGGRDREGAAKHHRPQQPGQRVRAGRPPGRRDGAVPHRHPPQARPSARLLQHRLHARAPRRGSWRRSTRCRRPWSCARTTATRSTSWPARSSAPAARRTRSRATRRRSQLLPKDAEIRRDYGVALQAVGTAAGCRERAARDGRRPAGRPRGAQQARQHAHVHGPLRGGARELPRGRAPGAEGCPDARQPRHGTRPPGPRAGGRHRVPPGARGRPARTRSAT